MSSQHLSDEAVAAFADGVLGGLARDRAARHVTGCAECRAAVRVQREAALALRTASAPHAPAELFDRLRALPLTTELPETLPTAIAADGSTVLTTFAPMAALVPSEQHRTTRVRPYVTTAAALTLAGALAAGSVASATQHTGAPQSGFGHVARHAATTTSDLDPSSVEPAHLWRGYAP
jgi:anti-sigma factor RsiW